MNRMHFAPEHQVAPNAYAVVLEKVQSFAFNNTLLSLYRAKITTTPCFPIIKQHAQYAVPTMRASVYAQFLGTPYSSQVRAATENEIKLC